MRRLLRRKAEHLVLASPFSRQIGEASNSHSMREPARDSCFDEIGREEGKRDRHVHLADAAALTLRNGFRVCCRIRGKLSEPTTSPGNRCDQCGARFRYPPTFGGSGCQRLAGFADDIPLSRPMIRCIIRAIRAIRLGRILYPEQAKIWLFPAESETGHLVEHKEERGVLSKWGNDLRQSYRTLAQAAGVSELDVHLLMNHSLPGVNAGYITRDKLLRDHLRKQQERVSAIVTERARDRDGRPCLSWLVSAKCGYAGHRRTQTGSVGARERQESPRSPRGWRSLGMRDKPLLSMGLPISPQPKSPL